MKGVLNLYKPKGITSSSAVGKVKHILGTRDVGHMGTLDPAGEGVLLLGVGKATRLFDYYLTKDKTYEAEFTFGYETDTLDGEGVIERKTACIPEKEQITAACKALKGTYAQIPPKYSAKSVSGQRAYALARSGQNFELPPKDVTVFGAEYISQLSAVSHLVRIHCSAGTYIRSVCRDMAYGLNSLATMTAIKRIQCGAFFVEDAVTLDELSERKEDCIVSVETALKELPRFDLPPENYRPLCNGVKLPCDRAGMFALYCSDELFGIAHSENGILKISSYLKD